MKNSFSFDNNILQHNSGKIAVDGFVFISEANIESQYGKSFDQMNLPAGRLVKVQDILQKCRVIKVRYPCDIL